MLPLPSQRWVSDSEPELGLGVILSAGAGRVEILFAAAGERRIYALASAPLRRVVFKEGDKVQGNDGTEIVVASVEEVDGLLTYHGEGVSIPEAELSETISFSSPEDRLLAESVDQIETFVLREEVLEMAQKIASSPVRGFVGPRIDLIPHQLSIADEVASRLTPRVLLADEVGLGKTIEAGLILHRLHHTGRAARILILLPPSLIHQWFVELYRRFNLPFSIYDEERCEAIEEGDPETNPFLESQLVLCSVDFLSSDEKRAAQALEAGWDLLIVDEAHHLEWTPEEASPEYSLVESFATATPGLLLLTATPQQLGPEGHFARLRLLDPDRYADLEDFLAEADRYEQVAEVIEKVADGKKLTKKDLGQIDRQSKEIGSMARALGTGEDEEREREDLVATLLDSFGTGRVMFRNTREAIPGFPERKAHLVPLEGKKEIDAKITWLAGLLRELGEEKILLICRSRELAEEINERLAGEIAVNAALFHEELTLVRRDRNAAWFGEKDGARILISSEIGSEGRNFQFAHNLVLFDLPNDPELLEQRIGRLDRIGQSETVQIHIPYLSGTSSESLASWYHHGLNAFEQALHGASEIVRVLGDQPEKVLAGEFNQKNLDELIAATVEARDEVTGRLKRGYDRLLQLNSNRPGASWGIARNIRKMDDDKAFEEVFLRLLDHFGVYPEEIAPRTYVLRAGELLTDAFPPIPDEGLGGTFDRSYALEREDLAFFSIDHPFVRDVLGLFLESEQGNSALGVWREPGHEGLLLEMLAVVETVAPAALNVDRFLPPRKLRIVIDHEMRDQTHNPSLKAAKLQDGDRLGLVNRGALRRRRLPAMINTALKQAEEQAKEIIEQARGAMEIRLKGEIDRLHHLAEINRNVTPQEIEAMEAHRDLLAEAIGTARARIAGLRVIMVGGDKSRREIEHEEEERALFGEDDE